MDPSGKCRGALAQNSERFLYRQLLPQLGSSAMNVGAIAPSTSTSLVSRKDAKRSAAALEKGLNDRSCASTYFQNLSSSSRSSMASKMEIKSASGRRRIGLFGASTAPNAVPAIVSTNNTLTSLADGLCPSPLAMSPRGPRACLRPHLRPGCSADRTSCASRSAVATVACEQQTNNQRRSPEMTKLTGRSNSRSSTQICKGPRSTCRNRSCTNLASDQWVARSMGLTMSRSAQTSIVLPGAFLTLIGIHWPLNTMPTNGSTIPCMQALPNASWPSGAL